jgi:NADP-reducing hydrogenase subunit HndB
MTALMGELEASGRNDIRLTTSGCIGVCSREPVMTVEVLDSEPVLYGDLDTESARVVFREHILEGRVVPQFVVGLGTGSA